MVSKYRDILDPDSFNKLQQATVAKRASPKKKQIGKHVSGYVLSFGS